MIIFPKSNIKLFLEIFFINFVLIRRKMSGTKSNIKTQINTLLFKIESILAQTVKTKRVVNQNNKILKCINFQTKQMFDTLQQYIKIDEIQKKNMLCEDLQTNDENISESNQITGLTIFKNKSYLNNYTDLINYTEVMN